MQSTSNISFVVHRAASIGQDPQELASVPFGGACIDGEHGLWSTSQVIEMDGSIPRASQAVLSLVNLNNGHRAQANDPIMQVIGNTGLAAGKIYLDSKHARVESMSGFFLESRFFITSAHFEPTDAAILEQQVSATISSCRLSEFGSFSHLFFL